MTVKRPKGFELKTGPYLLDEPVFDKIVCPDEKAVVAINRSLEQVSTFVRLYYYMISAYKDYIGESPTFKSEVYRVEKFRRQIQTKITRKGNTGKLGNELYLQLLSDANTILYLGDKIVETYQRTRDVCLRGEHLSSKFMLLRMIYNILDMEQKLFAEYPETRYAYSKTGENYLRAVFGKTTIRFTKEEVITQVRVAVRNSLPPTSE